MFDRKGFAAPVHGFGITLGKMDGPTLLQRQWKRAEDGARYPATLKKQAKSSVWLDIPSFA